MMDPETAAALVARVDLLSGQVAALNVENQNLQAQVGQQTAMMTQMGMLTAAIQQQNQWSYYKNRHLYGFQTPLVVHSQNH